MTVKLVKNDKALNHGELKARAPANASACGHAPRRHLTPRQLEVLALLCEGLPNKLISRQLNISGATVKVHIGCILRELGVASRLQAVVAARRLGLLNAPGHGAAVLASGQTSGRDAADEMGTRQSPWDTPSLCQQSQSFAAPLELQADPS